MKNIFSFFKKYVQCLKNIELWLLSIYTYMHEPENDKRQDFSDPPHSPRVCLFVDGMTAQGLMAMEYF